jgi:hypothetical protein
LSAPRQVVPSLSPRRGRGQLPKSRSPPPASSGALRGSIRNAPALSVLSEHSVFQLSPSWDVRRVSPSVPSWDAAGGQPDRTSALSRPASEGQSAGASLSGVIGGGQPSACSLFEPRPEGQSKRGSVLRPWWSRVRRREGAFSLTPTPRVLHEVQGGVLSLDCFPGVSQVPGTR